jgi:hypothetical protein
MSKKTIINFRASESETARWQRALTKDGRTLSQVCRAALDRLASRVERQTQTEGKDHDRT